MNRLNFITKGALFVPAIFAPRLIRAMPANCNPAFFKAKPAGGGGGGGGPTALLDYRFNGNLNDSSGNSSNLSTLAGSITYTTGQDSVSNHAAVFDGSSYAGLTDGTIANFTTGDFSIAAWVYVTGAVAGDSQQVVSKGQFGNGGYQIYLYDHFANGHYGVRCFMFGGSVFETSSNVMVVAPDAWHHVVFTRSGTTGHVYVNAADQTSSPTAGSPTSDSSEPFLVGAQTGGASQKFHGRMDELSVYSSELTSAQVSDLYAGNAQ